MNLFPWWVHFYIWCTMIMHQLGSLIQIQSCSQRPCFFSQQCQTKKITGSGNDIDLDPGHPEERHPYLGLHNARKPTLDYCTYLPGKTLPKESRDPVDNLYPCYSWHQCILRMKVSVETRPQLWRTRNHRNHNIKLFYKIKFGHPTTLTVLKWHFERKILLWSPSIVIAKPKSWPFNIYFQSGEQVYYSGGSRIFLGGVHHSGMV